MKKITRTQLNAAVIPIPPLDVQHRIAARLRGQLAEIDRAKDALAAQRKAIDALPAALLREVFGPPGHVAGSSKP
jgi:restriction endonuclease S subunit